MRKYLKTYCALVILCITLSMVTSLIYTTALAKDATVQAFVEGESRGYELNQAINVSADTTQEFEQRYGVHAPADMVLSELMIVLLEAFILFVLVVLYGNFLRERPQKQFNNKKHNKPLYSMNKFKKTIPLTLLFALVAQLLPGAPLTKEASANVVYDDPFESGDIFLVNDNLNSDILKLDADHVTPLTQEILQTMTNNLQLGAIAFLPSGDLVVTAHDNTVRCYTRTSQYSEECSWSPYQITGTSDVALSMKVSQTGDIWLAAPYSATFTPEGHHVVRIPASSGYATEELYDLIDYGVCSDETSPDKTTCVNNSQIWHPFIPISIVIDFSGDVWVSHFGALPGFSNFGNANFFATKLTCLDAQNNFNPCSGAGIDVDGRLEVGSTPYQMDINSKNEIFLTHLRQTNKITKISAFNLEVTETATSQVIEPQSLAINDQDEVWFTRNYNGGALSPGLLRCVTRDLSPCSHEGGTGLSYYIEADPDGMFIGKNQLIWVSSRVNANADTRLYCFDPSINYQGCARSGGVYDGNTNFVNPGSGVDIENSYILFNDSVVASGDPSGYRIKKIMDVVAGQGQVTVTATIDPTISLSLSSNSCNLGTLDKNSVATCAYDVSTATNATDGITVFATASSAALTGPSGDIDACSGTDCDGKGSTAVNAGQEEYGFYVSTANHTVAGSYATQDQATPTSATTLLTVAEPHDTTTSTVTHSASIDDLTPAGAYSHTITWTAVGSF